MSEKPVIREIEEFSTIQRWKLDLGLKSKTKVLSKDTWKQALSAIKNYLVFLRLGSNGAKTPDDLIEEAQKDIEVAEVQLRDFWMWLRGEPVEGVAPRRDVIDELDERKVNSKTGKKIGRAPAPTLSYSSARTMAYSRIAGFYSHNKIRLPPKITPAAEDPKVAETDDLHAVIKFDDETKKRSTDYTELRKFMDYLTTPRDRTVLMCMFSSSQDPIDVFSLTVGWVRRRVEAGHTRFFWRGKRVKTKESFRTFLSKQTAKMLVEYVTTHRAKAKDDDPIFVNRNGNPMTTGILDKIFRDAQERMGIRNSGAHGAWRPKRLRHIFRSICGFVKIDPGYANAFMGHKTDISGSYIGKSRDELEGVYVEIEPFLDPFRTSRDDQFHEMQEKQGVFTDELLRMSAELNNAKKTIEESKRTLQVMRPMIELAKKYDTNELIEAIDYIRFLKESPTPTEDEQAKANEMMDSLRKERERKKKSNT